MLLLIYRPHQTSPPCRIRFCLYKYRLILYRCVKTDQFLTTRRNCTTALPGYCRIALNGRHPCSAAQATPIPLYIQCRPTSIPLYIQCRPHRQSTHLITAARRSQQPYAAGCLAHSSSLPRHNGRQTGGPLFVGRAPPIAGLLSGCG